MKEPMMIKWIILDLGCYNLKHMKSQVKFFRAYIADLTVLNKYSKRLVRENWKGRIGYIEENFIFLKLQCYAIQ